MLYSCYFHWHHLASDLLIAIKKWLTHPQYITVLGSSKGEVSRQECIEKIAASINYVHSQTANVITGTSQTSQYAFFLVTGTDVNEVLYD